MDAPLSSPTRQQAQRTASQWPQSTNKGFGAVPPPPAPQQAQTPSTDALLKDFSLVAEAAKRAQMAVVMRDLGDLGLSYV
ncbi:hypothetical protein VM1G_09979 [Cytospora mali]|uniref:Uncharacterized protein n=1 Tax=Cytospora mali TaxID=578113 RepID=A0A194WD91_CYTMA|nr:hypothetical protein VM1G_09981 [Valsa mali]KUI74300.1 hypothetical protein VM1G_09979 [Valsa mali]